MIADVNAFALPIMAQREQERNRLASMAAPSPAFAPTASQYNALATYGGPTRAAAVASGGDPLAAGILETANELGMDPVDLATIISYETAGTFDPMQKGPTTQWGQHKGLIQWGEPQAREYGVDWNDPLGSQLGREGAIVRYFRDRGWQPGMGMLDAYSIVNAGGPGLYNRSDANNGGAPGTVADKVREQMGGHRRKAEAMFSDLVYRGPREFPPGAEQTPRPIPQNIQLSDLIQLLGA